MKSKCGNFILNYQIDQNVEISLLKKNSLKFSNLSAKFNKMVREPNVSPHKQIIKDDNVKECISIE